MAYKTDAMISDEVHKRYVYMRDNGHSDFVELATKCDLFFRGQQWAPEDKQRLRAHRRPALTINKILSTVGTLLGDQIKNRTEISFRARHPGYDPVAIALFKLFKYISDDNQLDWVRSDVFEDGIITGRGFYDVRLSFADNLQGEVDIAALNPKNVLIDPDADSYDPAKWSDVIVTKWLSPTEIEASYGKDAADHLKAKMERYVVHGADAVETQRDRFGGPAARGWSEGAQVPQARLIRIIDRQYRENTRREHFVDLQSGEIRPIPANWDRERIAAVVAQWGFSVIKHPTQRIKWRTVADDIVLHDEWSPYKNFTVVPYFPYFRRGKSVGVVENLIDPQELLNKVSSQELHVVNTTANSGWKVKTGALTTMTVADLESRGAETGLVAEVNDMDGLEKIQPNQYPSGLDRISYKAEEHIKTISAVTDTMMGQDREDVAAKAIMAKQQRGSSVHAKPLDNLSRSDYLLANVVLDIVQEYYTEPRIYNVVTDALTGASEELALNQPDQATGDIVNDLTMGEYQIIVTTQPAREAFEDSQFEQALRLKTEAGVAIPDSVLIENSRLMNRGEVLKQMQAAAQSPEAQAQQEMQMQLLQTQLAQAQADVDKTKAEAASKDAKAEATIAELHRKLAETEHQIETDNPEQRAAEKQQEMQMQREKHENDVQMQQEKHQMALMQGHDKHAFSMQTAAEQRTEKAQENKPNPTKEIK